MKKDTLIYSADFLPHIHQALEKAEEFTRMNNTSITVKEDGKFVILEIEETNTVFLANFFYFLGTLHANNQNTLK